MSIAKSNLDSGKFDIKGGKSAIQPIAIRNITKYVTTDYKPTTFSNRFEKSIVIT